MFRLVYDKYNGVRVLPSKSDGDAKTGLFMQVLQHAKSKYESRDPNLMKQLYGVTSLRALTEKVKSSTPAIKYKNEQTRKKAEEIRKNFTNDWGLKDSEGIIRETSKMSQRQKLERALYKAKTAGSTPRPPGRKSTGPTQTPGQKREKAAARRKKITGYPEEVYQYARTDDDDDLFMS